MDSLAAQLSSNDSSDNPAATDDTTGGTPADPGNTDNPVNPDNPGSTDTPGTPDTTPEPGTVTPDVSEFDSIDRETALVYFVSADGNDEASGEKETPFLTINKALNSLKAGFQAEKEKYIAGESATKTTGYVLLLSDISITSEIDFDSYRFAELDPFNVDIVIAGYQLMRTIDANGTCRVMKIGYSKGDITLKNLCLKNGYIPGTGADASTNTGAAGLWITSMDCNSGKAVNIKNCRIEDNISVLKGAAIWLKTGYVVNISNCIISDNNSGAGAAAIENEASQGLILSETSIINNIASGYEATSYNFGYVINSSAYLKLNGDVVIKDNVITTVSSSGTDFSKLSAIKNSDSMSINFAGPNYVKDNIASVDEGLASFRMENRNIVLTKSGDLVSTPIYFVGSCEGGSIHVSVSSSITSELRFTTGYKAYHPSVLPSSIFVSDCDYGIGYTSDGQNAAFVINSGSFGNPLDYSVNFAVSPRGMTSGKAANITVTPTVIYNGADVTASVSDDITWNLVLKCGSVTVASSTTNTLEVSAGRALPDTYTLYVTATLNGIAYDDSVSIVCMDVPEGMVYAPGASVNGAVSNSGVFVSGRSLTIPAMYAGESELTQKEYLEYCYYAHSGKEPDTAFTGDNYPACMVSWYDAIVYCNLRSMAEGLTPAYSLSGQTDPRLWDGIVSGSGANAGKYCGPLNNTDSWNNITFNTSANGWRIPVEAEWEYLARGGNLDSATQTAYAGSDDWTEVAWTTSNSSTPQLVKQKAANSLGLYDMSGNVYEYVWDWYGGAITSSVGITGYASPVKTSNNDYRRVVRGGAYNYGSAEAKISDRSVSNTPEMRWWNCGVRIVRNVN